MNDLELMELHIAALFTHDGEGRMVTNNEPEPDPDPAPRLFLGRTGEGNVWRARNDVPAAIAAELERILATEPPLGDPRQSPASLDALCRALTAQAPVAEVWQGPAWRFPDVLPSTDDAVIIEEATLDLVREHFPYTAEHFPARQPCAAVIAVGAAVSICSCSRLTTDAAEAGLFTVEAYRGRGHAVRVTAAWAAAVRRGGHIPLYSTSWDNLASQAVARKLGLVLYGVDLSIM